MPVNPGKKSYMGPGPTPSRDNRQVETGKAHPPVGNTQVERGGAGNVWSQFEKGSTKSATNNEVDRVGGAGRDRPKPL
jgi:hypothetical protein